MICLHTNYLILGLVPASPESQELAAWVRSGTPLITPMLAWYEFLCGPVTPVQINTMRAFLHEIVPFDQAQATVAARFFNAGNRKRALRVDAMIAGTAIAAGATLATNNLNDFTVFVPHGLKLLP